MVLALKDMVMEVYHHPSKYLKAITCMMDIYNLEHRGGAVGENKDQRNSIANNNHLLKQLVPCKVTIGPNPVVLALIEVLKR